MPYFEDLQVGQRTELGSFTFTAELIKQFARQFDPQPFHLDEAAGEASLFGGLAASGWHIGAVGMKLLVARRRREMEANAAAGIAEAPAGPSPGFRELKWLKPVLAGDTLTYVSEIIELRSSASRPQWGIMHARTSATNQRGETAYSFIGTAFIPRRS
jgi:acyl dehydratase